MATERKIVILIPIFDDWGPVALLIPLLDKAFANSGVSVQVLLVDDGSNAPVPDDLVGPAPAHLESIELLRLRRNLGHQRAIAIGLLYVYEHLSCEAVVVMDADGEDRPQDVPVLLREFYQRGEKYVIFASRMKRSENVAFRFFYHGYRFLHWLLTGVRVRVGNFSVVPQGALARLVVASETWSHFAAAIFHARLPYGEVPIERGRRLVGRSKMNFPSLVAHGISAISVFADIVGARLLAMTTLFATALLALIIAVLAVRLTTSWAIPGWATYVLGILLILLVQSVIVAFALTFMIVTARRNMDFIPLRDGGYFIDRAKRLYPLE